MKRILQVLLVVVALCAAVVLFLVVSHAMEDQRAYKPVLYLYPEQEQAVTVALDLEGTLDTVYPAPDQAASADGRTRASWTVDAAPDGTLTDASGREYPSLFWDATMALPFLEDKLAELGLSDREAADFITYWAPRIRSHEYTFVSFDASAYTQRASYGFTDASGEQIVPDTFIRVFMTIREADASTAVQPQTLTPPPPRAGFTAVEWGGTEQL